jgi:hypothetical protein
MSTWTSQRGVALLEGLYGKYPETLLVLLTDISAKEGETIQALATEVRGCMMRQPLLFREGSAHGGSRRGLGDPQNARQNH